MAEGHGVAAQRDAVQHLHDVDLMAVGVGDGVLVGRGRRAEAAEGAVRAADDGRSVIGDGAGDAGGVRALRAGGVVCLYAVLHTCPSVGDGVGVAARGSLVDLRPCAAPDLALQNVAGEVAVGVGGGRPRDAQVLAAEHFARDSDGRRRCGRLIVDHCIASIRVDGVGDQEIRGQITSGAQAVAAAVGVVPVQSAIGADAAGVVGRAGIGVPQPVVPRGTRARVAGIVGIGDAGGRHGGDAAVVVAEDRQLAAADVVAAQADLSAGQGEDLVRAGLRPAAVCGALADRDGGVQQSRPLVGGEGVQKTGEATVRVDTVPDVGGVRRLVCGVLCGVPLAGSRGAVEPLAQVRVDVAVVAVAAAVAVAVTRFCCVEAQHLDDLVGHERDAVGGVACVVLIGHDPDDRAAVQAAELDLRLVCEVAQFLGHELCLLSVMV